MKIKTRYFLMLIVWITFVTCITLQLSSKQERSFYDATVNKKIVQVKNFNVNSDSVEMNTSVKGTVFVSGDDGKVDHIRIVAWIEIDPDDWGGVAFYIPDKWQISNIISSYPENEAQLPADYVSTWTTGDTELYEWRRMVEVGRDRSYRSTGGGEGTVVIEIVPDEKADPPKLINLGVEVGSADNGNYKVMGTDSIEIPIPLQHTE